MSARHDQIRNRLFFIKTLMADIHQAILDLKDLGCDAALKYTTVSETEGELELIHRINDEPVSRETNAAKV